MLGRVIVVYLFWVSLASCGERYNYNQSQPVADRWQLDDAISFYNDGTIGNDSLFQLSISHTDEYAFQNLYLRMIAKDSVDTLLDTVSSIEFTDGAGLWIGINTANIWTVAQTIPLTTSQSFSLSIYPYGRVEEITEIKTINLRAK
jgi:gliding motility-associated lipoprotein GldH